MEGSQKCKIQFINADGTKFAESVMNDEHYEKFVQPCTDSSRFFAVLLLNE